MAATPNLEELSRRWGTEDPERIVGRGHPVGDFLEAHAWRVLERTPGHLRARAHLPDALRNVHGDLFGGFTPTYVDFFAIYTFHGARDASERRCWLSTANLRVDYFAPIRGPEFEIEGNLIHRRGRTGFVEIRFFDAEGELTALGHATLIEQQP